METISPRREKTRQKLMSAAVDVIAERGFAAASVEEICERAGFTRGAFYSNFESKEDLALDLLRRSAQAQLDSAEAAIHQASQTPPEDDTVDQLIDRSVDLFVATQPTLREDVLLQAELRMHAIRNPDFGRTFAHFDHEMSGLFAQTIESTLRARGLELALPAGSAIELLHAIHGHATLNQLMPDMGDPQLGAYLKMLLLALVRRA